MAKLVSAVYGEALFELALEEGKVQELSDEVKVIQKILDENPDFSRFMNHPHISKEEKLDVLEQVFDGRVSEELTGFFRIMAEKSRFKKLDEVLRYFQDKVLEYQKIGVAYVTSAVTLSGEQKEKIEQRLLETTDYQSMQMHYREDESLIGGLVIRIGDRVVDSSIRTKLEDMRSKLLKVQLPDEKER